VVEEEEVTAKEEEGEDSKTEELISMMNI